MANSNSIAHAGVKGMKWGVRKAPEVSGGGKRQGRIAKFISDRRRAKAEKAAARLLKASQDKWDENFNKNWINAYNNAADYANDVLLPRMNKKYGGVVEGSKQHAQFERAFEKFLTKEYDRMFGKRPE